MGVGRSGRCCGRKGSLDVGHCMLREHGDGPCDRILLPARHSVSRGLGSLRTDGMDRLVEEGIMPTCSGRPLENSYAEKHNECGRLTKGLAADEIERAGLRRADDLRKILDGGS